MFMPTEIIRGRRTAVTVEQLNRDSPREVMVVVEVAAWWWLWLSHPVPSIFDVNDQLNRALLFRRIPSRHANLAYLYRAFGIALLWGRYHQVLGPRRHLP